MKFSSYEHLLFYNRLAGGTGMPDDPNHQALVYLLGVLPDTRRRFRESFNAEKDLIIPSVLNKPWQTGGTQRVTRLAFNLFNGFSGYAGKRKKEQECMYTPDQIMEPSLLEYYLDACRLRYEFRNPNACNRQ